MGESQLEQAPSSEEVFPTEYLFEVTERLNRLEWGKLLDPTVLHNPYMEHRIYTDTVDPQTGMIYHLSTHPHFLDLPKNTPEDLIPGYGSRNGWITSPLLSLINRQTLTPTHLLMANFEQGYDWMFGYGLQYGISSTDGSRPGTVEEQKEFKALFERLAP